MSRDLLQNTLAAPVSCAGVGVHSGEPVRLGVRPAPADTGVVFVRTDVEGRDNRIPATAAAVSRTVLNTELSNAAGVSVSTVEHLMATLAALGIDNAVVEIDGPELPVMDGSATPFVRLFDAVGRRTQEAPRRYLEITAPVSVEQGDRSAALVPAAGFSLDVEIVFPTRAIGRQRLVLDLDADSFRRELAPARTFGFASDVEALRSQGLARGAGLDNAVAIDGDHVLNPEGLRFPDEFVRHKAMDAVGDLYVLGMPMIGRYQGRMAGHALNNALARAVLARPDAWRIRTFAPALAQAV